MSSHATPANAILQPLPPGERGTAARQAHAQLQRAIIEARLPPGTSLSEVDVAQQLGVSRGPVRQAFWQLANEGLLRVTPQVGSFVCRISLQRLRDMLFVREAIECAAVRAVLRANPQPEQLAVLDDIVARQRSAIARKAVEDALREDEAFHRAMLELAGHEHAWPFVHQTRTYMDRVRRLAIPQLKGQERAVEQHDAIVRALAEHRPDAVDLMGAHVGLVAQFIDELRRQVPDYFED